MKVAVFSLLALAIALAVASPIQEPFQVNAQDSGVINTSKCFVQWLMFVCINRRSRLSNFIKDRKNYMDASCT